MNFKKISKGLYDFHTHSAYSDGAESPAKLAERAKMQNISAMALTDHNTLSGLDEFNKACLKNEIFAIPLGVEIYAEIPESVLEGREDNAPDLIMLGKNPRAEIFEDYLHILRDYRKNYWIPKLISGLEKEGFKIPFFSWETQLKSIGHPPVLNDIISNPANIKHLIKYVRARNPNIKKAEIEYSPACFMNRYLFAPGKPAFSKKITGFDLHDAIALAESMNCRLFIAHPGGEFNAFSKALLEYYIKNRIHGIEIRNYFNTPEQNDLFDSLAKTNSLARSGGSDYHFPTGKVKLGIADRLQNQIPKDVLGELWERLPD